MRASPLSFVLAVSAFLLSSSPSFAFCFRGGYDEEAALEQRSKAAIARKKEINYADGARYEPVIQGQVKGKLDRIEVYANFLLSQLNADSLFTEQLLYPVSRDIVNNGRAGSLLETYPAADGQLCNRFVFTKDELRLDSLRSLKKIPGEFAKEIFELRFSVLIPVTGRDGESLRAEPFSMQVEATSLWQARALNALTVPQFIGTEL